MSQIVNGLRSPKNILTIVGIVLGVQVLLLLIMLALMFFFTGQSVQYYETCSIADYGCITGNHDNTTPKAYIDSFFPEEIESNFSEVIYSYRAEDGDTYGYEAYLEFTIEDFAEFSRYVSELQEKYAWTAFPYDNDYAVCTIADSLDLTLHATVRNGEYDQRIGIEYAKIGKILYCEQEQKVIFVALGVYDGGYATTDYLCRFFERFDIDPIAYAQNLP